MHYNGIKLRTFVSLQSLLSLQSLRELGKMPIVFIPESRVI